MKVAELYDFLAPIKGDLEVEMKGSAGTASIVRAVHVQYERVTSDGDADVTSTVVLEVS